MSIEGVTGRVVHSYGLMYDRVKAEAMRPEIIKFLKAACAEGEVDDERLAVGCMKHLRNLDQRTSGKRGRRKDEFTASL